MAASSNDKFSKTSNGDIASVATVTAPRSTGVTALSVDTQLNWPIDTGIKFSTFRLDSNNNKISGTQTDWKGVSNGTNAISSLVRTGGASDSGNLVGDKVVMVITAQWGEDIVEGLLVSHNQTGALLPAAVQTAIGAGGITNNNIATVQTSKLANPYKFSVYCSAALNQPNGAAKITFDAEEYDTGNNYDNTTNYRFTAPVAGFYHFSGAFIVNIDADGLDLQLLLYKNGSACKYGLLSTSSKPNGSLGSVISCDVQLAANDYVELYGFKTGSASPITTGASNTYFQGHLVSST